LNDGHQKNEGSDSARGVRLTNHGYLGLSGGPLRVHVS
jgi:hypothetical protein